jgi:hypothetical protein
VLITCDYDDSGVSGPTALVRLACTRDSKLDFIIYIYIRMMPYQIGSCIIVSAPAGRLRHVYTLRYKISSHACMRPKHTPIDSVPVDLTPMIDTISTLLFFATCPFLWISVHTTYSAPSKFSLGLLTPSLRPFQICKRMCKREKNQHFKCRGFYIYVCSFQRHAHRHHVDFYLANIHNN